MLFFFSFRMSVLLLESWFPPYCPTLQDNNQRVLQHLWWIQSEESDRLWWLMTSVLCPRGDLEQRVSGAVRWMCGAENEFCASGGEAASCNNTLAPISPPSRSPQVASLTRTCRRRSDLLHVGLQHVRVPRAVRIEFGVKTRADVLGRHVSPSRITGRDFGVPVRHQDVVPVNVFSVHEWITVPSVIKYMNIIKYGPLRTSVGQCRFGVAARRAGFTRRCGGTTGHWAPIHLPSYHRQQIQTWSQIREAVPGLQGPQSHHCPKDE